MSDGTTNEGLLELPGPGPGAQGSSSGGRWLPRVVIGWAALLILGTALVDLSAPVQRPQLKGAEAVQDQQRRADAKVADGSLARWLEYDYRLTSRVRRTLAQPYTDLLFQQLGETSSAVLIGSDDWLFLSRRAEWMSTGGLASETLGIERIGALEAALSARAQALGTRILWMHIPRKAVVEAQHLPRGVEPRVDLERRIVPMTRDRGAEVIDLLGAFMGMGAEPAYRKTDSHWSSYGRALAAFETARQSGFLVPEEQRLGRIKRVRNNAGHGAILNTLSITPTARLEALEPAERLLVAGAPPRNSQAPGVVTGTSFTGGQLSNLLAHYFGLPFEAVHNSGGSPYGKLGEIFTSRLDAEAQGAELPKVIVIDVPNHFVSMAGLSAGSWPVNRSAVRWLAERAPDTLTPVATGGELISAEHAGGTAVPFRGSSRLAAWRAGDVAHSGDGAISIELDLDVEGEGVSLQLFSPEVTQRLTLRAGRNHLVLPLIAPRPGALGGQVTLGSSKPASVVVRSCRLVAAASPAAVAGGPVLVRHAALLVRCAAQGTQRRPAVLTVTSADGELSQSFEFEGIYPGAPIVVAPGRLVGRRLGEVRLEDPPGSAAGSTVQSGLEIADIQLLVPAPE